MAAHSSHATSVTSFPDFWFPAFAGVGKTAKLWSVSPRGLPRALEAHERSIPTASLSSDGVALGKVTSVTFARGDKWLSWPQRTRESRAGTWCKDRGGG
jgi:hypothetical protein